VEGFQPALNFLAALGCPGGVVYSHHSQSCLTALLVSLVPFSEAALVSETLVIGHQAESYALCIGTILQGQVPLVLWSISTSPETIRVCINGVIKRKFSKAWRHGILLFQYKIKHRKDMTLG